MYLYFREDVSKHVWNYLSYVGRVLTRVEKHYDERARSRKDMCDFAIERSFEEEHWNLKSIKQSLKIFKTVFKSNFLGSGIFPPETN